MEMKRKIRIISFMYISNAPEDVIPPEVGIWKKFSESKPTDGIDFKNHPRPQVYILFSNPQWGVVIYGMYSIWAVKENEDDDNLCNCLSMYNWEEDKFYQWEYDTLPTHWMIVPKFPD